MSRRANTSGGQAARASGGQAARASGGQAARASGGQAARASGGQAARTSVGQAVAHESAIGHVTGQAQYIDDLPVPTGTLYVATGFCAVPRATIERLDLAAVRAAPGVVDVISAADLPASNDVGPVFPGDPLLADGELRYAAQPVFAVAASSQRAALQAARLATIETAALPALLNVSDALAAEAFVLPSRSWAMGEVDAATPAPPDGATVTGELYIRGQEHFYLEGQVALAVPEDHDELRVYSSTQHPDEVQHLIARVLGEPMHRIRVTCRRMGGAFGGKESQAAAPACIAALFARRTGKPVKYRLPRQDDMRQTGKRHDFLGRYRLTADAAGHLVSANIELAGKCGHSPDLSDGIVDRAMFHATNAYFVPNVRITGHRCETHTVSNTAFRGFGGPQGMLVIEAALDELAHAQGRSPLALRKQNLYAPGRHETPYGQRVDEFVLHKLIEHLEESADYAKRQAEARAFNARSQPIKRGLALTPVQFGIAFTSTHLNQAGALVHLFTDGTVEVNHAGTEMGQGLYTKIQQVAAEALGIDLDRVRLSATQTDKVPNGAPTAASSGSDLNGMAVLDACNRLKTRLQQVLIDAGWPTEAPTFADNAVRLDDRRMEFTELVQLAHRERTSLSSTGFYRTPDIHFDKSTGRGHPFYYYAHGAAATEVMIDTRTGAYRVERVDIAHDAGSSLNPAVDLGQIEGGFVQGMGWLTTEELLWNDNGELITTGPATYKIPAAGDCPPAFNVHLLPGANPQPTVYRSKAVGEPPLMLAISVWCALRDACYAAGGYSHFPGLAAPATAEAVYRAVQEARASDR